MATEQLVTLRLHGEIAIVSLNRPDRHNALIPELLTRLSEVLEHLRQRLEAERENFVSQVQTRQTLDGIDSFLRRKEHV